MQGWRCRCCGAVHDELPMHYGAPAPALWVTICPLQPEPLRELEASADLESARDRLLKLGFRKLDQATVPRMRGPWPEKLETKAVIARRFLH